MNYLDFISSLIYGDLGVSELGPPPLGAQNHLIFTRNWYVSPAPAAGSHFLAHHIDTMLARYLAWRSLHFLPPVRPWDGSDAFPDDDPATAPVGPTLPASLSGTPFPAGWTTNDLGTAVRVHYNALRNYVSPAGNAVEMDDEVKAPYSYRYWAFMRWVADLRRRLLGQPVLPVGIVYDRDGTILSEKEFADVFHQVHHVWHPNSGSVPSWTVATPGFRTGVGQHRRKKQISRAQVGAEFFAFHRDHLLLFDRWLARTGQDPIQSINICAHDTGGVAPWPDDPAWPSALNQLDVVPKPMAGAEPEDFWQGFLGGTDMPPGFGYPLVSYGSTPPAVEFNPAHATYWNGNLGEFSSVGEMGQRFALDFNPFPAIPVPGTADSGYHGIGHVLNGDLAPPVANNYVPRFFAWHGWIDDLWVKRQPRFVTFVPVQADGSAFPQPVVITIVRDLSASSDTAEPSAAIAGLDLATGRGTLRIKVRVRPDPFNRPLDLSLRCEILREAGGLAPVIALPPRNLVITVGAPGGPSERQQDVDFIEDFIFDGSAGTTDPGGHGPFVADNTQFPPAGPTSVGFVNSLVRITGWLTCRQKPDGSAPATPGTISSIGSTVAGVATAFQTTFRQGDLIRAGGQLRMITDIASNTTMTLYEAFAPAVSAGSPYERLDGFDHEEVIDIPLVQEKLAPAITAYLDRSSFSQDQVDAVAVGGQSVFEDAFYIVVQDRTERPAPIVWPPEVEPLLRSLIARPIRAAGLHPDPTRVLSVELRDVTTNTSLAGQVDVLAVAGDPEDPSLHPSVPQRITYRCRVTFVGNTAFAGMNPGDLPRELKLVITATDRAGNQVTDELARVRLQLTANPYMLDGPVSWLSIDTRVFKVEQGQAMFGVAAGWTDPNVFITQVIENLRVGGGTAGGQSFQALATDQAAAVLEYSTQVGGVNIHNFALGRIRLQSQTGASAVRASFRLFRWGVANVSYDDNLAYRNHAPSGIALLGRTAANELASIPFFAAPRVPLGDSMTTQPDPKNLFSFGPTGGVEAASYYGAYLDVNSSTPRFPQAFVNDGGFSGIAPADLRSVRDLMMSHHQCLIAELVYGPDPTAPGATPGTSDNLAQRNLLIVQTANPGTQPITRAVQHSFDIDLTRREQLSLELDGAHEHDVSQPTRERRSHGPAHHERAGAAVMPMPARPVAWIDKAHDHHVDLDHLTGSWLEQAPNMLKGLRRRARAQAAEISRWQIDPDEWKSNDGLDELLFLWNQLPAASIVDIYLPGASVEEIINYRNLRHAPATVRIIDSQTLRLDVAGPTYLPIPAYWADHLAGLITIGLPEGIEKGQRFAVDVVHLRSDARRVLGGFQISVHVRDSKELFEAERRILSLMHRRLNLTPISGRWHPVLERQVEFHRERAKGFFELAGQPGGSWDDPTAREQGQAIRIVLERIQILDDHDPFIKGAGEFRFRALATTRDNGGLVRETRFPKKGHYRISDRPGRNSVQLDVAVFEGFVEDHLALEVAGIEMDTFDPDDSLGRYRRVFDGRPETWLGSYGPGDEQVEPEDIGDWRLWYRIERA